MPCLICVSASGYHLKPVKPNFEGNMLIFAKEQMPAYVTFRPRILSQACGETIPEEDCKGYCTLLAMVLHPMLGGLLH